MLVGCQQLDTERVEVDLVAQSAAGLHGLRGVVAAASEAAVDRRPVRWRAGWNRAATVRLEAATASSDCPSRVAGPRRARAVMVGLREPQVTASIGL
jgi:cysteine sulfinate desulfinase/cysteine desulfurase-like protein